MPEYISTPETPVVPKDITRLERPRRYRVLLHNDHYTTMEFVVEVLKEVFRKTEAEAKKIMLNVHKQGLGVAGTYVKPVAEAKVLAVHKKARSAGYPLRCSSEPE